MSNLLINQLQPFMIILFSVCSVSVRLKATKHSEQQLLMATEQNRSRHFHHEAFTADIFQHSSEPSRHHRVSQRAHTWRQHGRLSVCHLHDTPFTFTPQSHSEKVKGRSESVTHLRPTDHSLPNSPLCNMTADWRTSCPRGALSHSRAFLFHKIFQP